MECWWDCKQCLPKYVREKNHGTMDYLHTLNPCEPKADTAAYAGQTKIAVVYLETVLVCRYSTYSRPLLRLPGRLLILRTESKAVLLVGPVACLIAGTA